jgi:hypothetical protein
VHLLVQLKVVFPLRSRESPSPSQVRTIIPKPRVKSVVSLFKHCFAINSIRELFSKSTLVL